MRTIPITLDVRLTKRGMVRRVQKSVMDVGLQIDMTSMLATYPGSIHWHIVKMGEKGTLELTYWPEKNSLWFNIHLSRRAPWIEDALTELTRLLGHIT